MGVILLALVISCVIGLYFHTQGGTVAVISRDGKELYRVRLDRVDKPYTIEIEGECRNTIEIEPGRIRVVSATCPDKICVDTGWIPEGGPIVCLPNRLVIELEGGEDTADLISR